MERDRSVAIAAEPGRRALVRDAAPKLAAVLAQRPGPRARQRAAGSSEGLHMLANVCFLGSKKAAWFKDTEGNSCAFTRTSRSHSATSGAVSKRLTNRTDDQQG